MICSVVGARPNFVKMAPVIQEFQRRQLPHILVHTGQHYDQKMSKVFFEELHMPHPDVYLGVGSGSHADQTARIMLAFEPILLSYQPRLVVVAGDVNSTLACALVAAKLNIPVAHVESGLRSFDPTMPEEINRVLTDHITELLFTTEPSGHENLQREGIESEKIHFVGNTMIDSLRTHLHHALERKPWETYGFEPKAYGIVTMHRPSNVDNVETVCEIALALDEIGADIPLLFPMHPRTLSKGQQIWQQMSHVRIVDPLGYLEFLGLIASARFVLTDSGGIQEETTALRVPCLTLRSNTERPITITRGTNQLVTPSASVFRQALAAIDQREPSVPELWDGQATLRIADAVQAWLK